MATKTKTKGISLFAIALLVAGGVFLWSRTKTTSKYQLGDQLTQVGVEGVYTIDGIWKVNDVLSYIMEGPGIIGQVAFPVTEIDASSAWAKVV